MPYLFVHFKEKITPDGEQVYFGISRDGFNWEKVNDGNPILTASLGEKGCRDIEIVRLHTGGFVILTTDLCVANRYDENLKLDWSNINRTGSKCLRMWKTDDLVHFSEERLIHFGRDDFGCMWAPEVFFDEENEKYIIHWSSNTPDDNYQKLSIYACETKDFEAFSEPVLFFTKETGVIDSHIRKIDGTYHLFYKNSEPSMNMHATSNSLYGPYEHDRDFEDYMTNEVYWPGSYEAGTSFVLSDGRWCILFDFFGCEKEKMGYVPFISSKPGDMKVTRCTELFSFPYGFKHGGVIEITDEEYEQISNIIR